MVDTTIHLGDIVITVVSGILLWLGRNIVIAFKVVRAFVDRVELMDKRIEESAVVIDKHTDILHAAKLFEGDLDQVSQKRRRTDRSVLGLGLLFLSVSLTLDACGPVAGPKPPAPPSAPDLRPLATFVYDVDGRPISGAECSLQTAADVWTPAPASNGDGYVLWAEVPRSLTATAVRCTADTFLDYESSRFIDSDYLSNVVLTADHVDPARYTDAQLLHFRGSLFTVRAGDCDLPWGPRPHQRDNVAFFGGYFYTKAQRQCVYALWKARGYTHGPVGPFIDPGYHDQTPGIDFRQDGGAAAADLIQEIWDAGLIPVVFVTPDGWTVQQLQTLEPIFRSPRWQRLVRVVVNGFEQQGSKYGWSNNTYVGHLSWLASVFPHAVRGLHTIADIEAPVGDGDETVPSRCTPAQVDQRKCLSGNGDAWSRVTPYIHFWLHQSEALFHPQQVDPSGDGRTDGEHWVDLWTAGYPGSFVQRFGLGKSGWPTTSAGGTPLLPIPGEYLSYRVYWDTNFTEDMARDWGQKALRAGARGFMDGGRE
jgi:hypothetical protein